MPAPASASLAGCLPTRVTIAPLRRSTQADSRPSFPSPTTATRVERVNVTCSVIRNAGGQRFDENGLIVGDGVGNEVEVALGHGDSISHRAIVPQDSEDGPVRAVVGQARPARCALVANVVDLGGPPDGRQPSDRQTRGRGYPGTPCIPEPVARRSRRSRPSGPAGPPRPAEGLARAGPRVIWRRHHRNKRLASIISLAVTRLSLATGKRGLAQARHERCLSPLFAPAVRQLRKSYSLPRSKLCKDQPDFASSPRAASRRWRAAVMKSRKRGWALVGLD